MSNVHTTAELLDIQFDATNEKEYRRGYMAGFLAALDYVAEGIDLARLYRFRDFELELWATGDCGAIVEPPTPDSTLRRTRVCENHKGVTHDKR